MPYKNREDNIAHCKQYRKDNQEYFKEYERQRKKNNPGRHRKSMFKCKYNLSLEDWLKMWEDQNGRCEICGEKFIEPGDAHVDHNHKTNKIRGLLCSKCNFGLGNFDDDPGLLIKASKYLKKY